MPYSWNEPANTVFALLAVGGVIFVISAIFYRIFRNKYAPVRSEKMQVINKFADKKFSDIFGTMARSPQYYVVFSNGKKHRSFRVSEFSWAGYRVGEHGTLKYKGSRLIDFS